MSCNNRVLTAKLGWGDACDGTCTAQELQQISVVDEHNRQVVIGAFDDIYLEFVGLQILAED